MTPKILASVLQGGISLSAALTAFRIGQTRLYRRYPVLFWYMVFQAISELSPLLLNPAGRAYYYIWIYSEPIEWVLDILVVRELCLVILERYPGLVTLGRWGMYVGVAISACLSYLSLLPQIDSHMSARSRIVAYWVATGRGITLALAMFLILMLFALARYPVHLCRNVILNAGLFTFVFLSTSLEAILRTIFDLSINPWLVTALTAIEVVFLLIWFFRLDLEGEHMQFSWIHFGPEYEKRVLERLDTLNRIMGGNA